MDHKILVIEDNVEWQKQFEGLLRELGHPAGTVFQAHEQKMKDVLERRNHSFLAHGTKPVVQADWLKIREVVWTFINECDAAVGIQGLAKIQPWLRELP